MKKRGLAAVLAGILTVGCGNGSSTAGAEASGGTTATAEARTLEDIKADGTIKIGVFSDKNPFGYVDENGEVQGYDVYFAKRIAKDLLGSEDKVEFVYVEAASRVEYL